MSKVIVATNVAFIKTNIEKGGVLNYNQDGYEYSMGMIFEENSETHKELNMAFDDLLDEFNGKTPPLGELKHQPIKPFMGKDEDGKEVRRMSENGKPLMIMNAKNNVKEQKWVGGAFVDTERDFKVPVANAKGVPRTDKFYSGEFKFGAGSTGDVHLKASYYYKNANSNGISLRLIGIQYDKYVAQQGGVNFANKAGDDYVDELDEAGNPDNEAGAKGDEKIDKMFRDD